MTDEEQMDLWLAGDYRCPNDRDECCPDFACCAKGCEHSQEIRQKFYDIYIEFKKTEDREEMDGMLYGFLGEMLKKELSNGGPKVFLTNGEKSELI